MAVAAERLYGGQTMVEPLRRVLVRRPPADTSDWQRYGWRSQPDPVRLAEEHEALCRLLDEAGAEVVVAPATTLDAIYTYDPALICDRGAVLRDVSAVDTRLTLLGLALPFPVLLAPTGFQRLFHPEGELATARGAGAAGALYTLSTPATTSLEDVAGVAKAQDKRAAWADVAAALAATADARQHAEDLSARTRPPAEKK